jgi:hypothetical protein
MNAKMEREGEAPAEPKMQTELQTELQTTAQQELRPPFFAFRTLCPPFFVSTKCCIAHAKRLQ